MLLILTKPCNLNQFARIIRQSLLIYQGTKTALYHSYSKRGKM